MKKTDAPSAVAKRKTTEGAFDTPIADDTQKISSSSVPHQDDESDDAEEADDDEESKEEGGRTEGDEYDEDHLDLNIAHDLEEDDVDEEPDRITLGIFLSRCIN